MDRIMAFSVRALLLLAACQVQQGEHNTTKTQMRITRQNASYRHELQVILCLPFLFFALSSQRAHPDPPDPPERVGHSGRRRRNSLTQPCWGRDLLLLYLRTARPRARSKGTAHHRAPCPRSASKVRQKTTKGTARTESLDRAHVLFKWHGRWRSTLGSTGVSRFWGRVV